MEKWRQYLLLLRPILKMGRILSIQLWSFRLLGEERPVHKGACWKRLHRAAPKRAFFKHSAQEALMNVNEGSHN